MTNDNSTLSILKKLSDILKFLTEEYEKQINDLRSIQANKSDITNIDIAKAAIMHKIAARLDIMVYKTDVIKNVDNKIYAKFIEVKNIVFEVHYAIIIKYIEALTLKHEITEVEQIEYEYISMIYDNINSILYPELFENKNSDDIIAVDKIQAE